MPGARSTFWGLARRSVDFLGPCRSSVDCLGPCLALRRLSEAFPVPVARSTSHAWLASVMPVGRSLVILPCCRLAHWGLAQLVVRSKQTLHTVLVAGLTGSCLDSHLVGRCLVISPGSHLARRPETTIVLTLPNSPLPLRPHAFPLFATKPAPCHSQEEKGSWGKRRRRRQ